MVVLYAGCCCCCLLFLSNDFARESIKDADFTNNPGVGCHDWTETFRISVSKEAALGNIVPLWRFGNDWHPPFHGAHIRTWEKMLLIKRVWYHIRFRVDKKIQAVCEAFPPSCQSKELEKASTVVSINKSTMEYSDDFALFFLYLASIQVIRSLQFNTWY